MRRPPSRMDTDHIVVGDDEKRYLSVYRLDGGERTDKFDLRHLSQHDEADIEAATVLADRIVWISSNGRDGGREGRARAGSSSSLRIA